MTNSETVIFVYDGLGKIVAEYTTKQPPQNPTTSYTATDMLGSPRVITDSNGNVTSRRDFQPFGEELSPNGVNRTATQKYGSADGIRQKFTSYQRDDETLLDFAEARMYENRHARFTAVDPLLASGKSTNPQTFNRYVYVVNNPLVLTDPTGLQIATTPNAREKHISERKAPGPISHREFSGSQSSSRKSNPSEPSLSEFRFFIAHPLSALQIGFYSDDGTNITSIAGRFAVNAKWEDTGEGGKTNALRHAIWSAMLTRSFGDSIAQEAMNAHEGKFLEKNMGWAIDNLVINKTYNSLSEADTAVDTLNNITGTMIGNLNYTDGSPISNSRIPIEALSFFREYGLFTVEKKEADNTYRPILTRITEQEFNDTQKEFSTRDEKGFSPGYVPVKFCNATGMICGN